ncbi:MAG: DUF349 domain-containing protein [Bacteroidia bacterium]
MQTTRKREWIEKLDTLLKSEDITAAATEVRLIRQEFETLLTREKETARQEFLSDGGFSKEFEFHKDAEDKELEEKLASFQELKKAHEKKIVAEQLRHLELKRGIIEKVKALGDIQTQPGRALKTLKDLQAQWKDAGPVSSHVYKDLQNEYSKAVESFYYSLDIYKVLQDHDFKKNLELKSALIEKLDQLSKQNSIKEVERIIKIYRNEWDEVGPVPHDKWEGLKTLWRAGLDLVYARIKAHYKSVEEQKEKNLAHKNELVEKTRLLLEQLPADEEGWKASTDTILSFQKEWKSTGFTRKGKNEAAWNSFRELCDRFFDAKNQYYAVLKEGRSDLKKQKLDLLTKAEELSTSTLWKETSEKMIRLQADWKKIPGIGIHEESRMFHRFRKACNQFFDAKKKHFEAQDAAAVNEVKKKEESLALFLAFEPSGDEAKDKETLRQFSTEWKSGGQLPPKDRKRLNDLFYQYMDSLYQKLNVNESELALIQFTNKLERLEKEDPEGHLLQKEYDHIKKHAEQIHLDILKYENNLGFFKSSKSDNPLLKDIHEKIALEKEKLQLWKTKQKMAREALNRVLA